ncbi:hypothetical protein AVEN_168577-1 [Araneus ventricosus]|uniref:Uncharacterized protein n=1 Tax=Araneus ventricosus TaxID=182803 RepID=A0A4Y2LU43_ARAVE|nr:hypothetical protein AVEN_168577-1 [Araneus ventricosus]
MGTFVTTLYHCRRQGFQKLLDKLSLLSGRGQHVGWNTSLKCYDIPAGGQLIPMYLTCACNRPRYTTILRWNRASNLESRCTEVEPPGYYCPRNNQETSDDSRTETCFRFSQNTCFIKNMKC